MCDVYTAYSVDSKVGKTCASGEADVSGAVDYHSDFVTLKLFYIGISGSVADNVDLVGPETVDFHIGGTVGRELEVPLGA